MTSEMDRFALERKEMKEKMQEIESQLEWLRSKRDDEIAKFIVEKKLFQERLHDAETQLSQLKSRKRDELKLFLPFHKKVLCGMIESIGAAAIEVAGKKEKKKQEVKIEASRVLP
ncbi:hypothetical protein L2E82_02012 [Cichorium intybus]|uniref:Uncharacterized protein n=1 Tax=Cichorium intybus TaxID=13427 RepID=A0ACB9H1R8_CICIN|nr:hypothetical protein L2E82_02012 [Cichorium intybus]